MANKVLGLDGESESVRYVSCERSDNPSNVFRKVTRQVNPPLISGGGVILEGCRITTPDNKFFYSLYFHGDLDGWQRQIEQGAQELNLLSAKIVGNSIVLSNGRIFTLSDCRIDFD